MKNKRNVYKNFLFVWKETIKCEKLFLGYLLVSMVLGVAVSVLTVYFPAMVINNIENNVKIYKFISDILLMVLVLSLVTIIRARVSIEFSVTQEVCRMNFVSILNNCIMKRRYGWLEKAENQVLINQATDYLYTSNGSVAVNGIHNSTVSLLTMILGVVTYISILKNISIMVIILLLAVNIVFIYLDKNKNSFVEKSRTEWAVLDKKISYINEKVTKNEYGKDIRTFGCVDWLLKKLHMLIDDRMKAHMQLMKKEYIGTSIKQGAILIRDLIIVVYTLYLVYTSVISMAEFVLYSSAVIQLFGYVTMGIENLMIMNSASNEVDIIRRVLSDCEDEELTEFSYIEHAPEIEFSNVSFKYENADDYTLKNISLRIKAGEKLALVGENGSGKTTFIKLLCGLYKPTEGKILIAGKDISQYSVESIQKCFSVVFQDKLLLPFTISENIALTRKENIDKNKLDNSIRFAGLDKQFDNFEVPLIKAANEDGIELSGGEKQKLLLARALYKEAPILLLDEPTAALDPIAEEEVYRQYNSMTEDRTSVFISHRLASTVFCDRIVLLKDGEIVESGTHQDLLKSNGHYSDMFNVQKKYYEEVNA